MRNIKSITSLLLVTALSSQLFSCGYLLYPERRGQKPTGKVDWAVTGLDAIGLLFYVIPGLIAFGIDLGTGTIYLPKSASDVFSSNDISKLDVKNFDKIKISFLFVYRLWNSFCFVCISIYNNKS